MAKACMVAREKVRIKMSRLARERRLNLKKIITDVKTGYDERMIAIAKLNKRPRNECACRVRTRCALCGRPRAVYRKFGLCRICLRNAVMRGDVTGVVKSSW